MRACDHPDYQAEIQHLTRVLSAVDNTHEAVVVTGASGGAAGPATALLRGRTTAQLGLQRASNSPYFARVSDEEDAYYVGYEKVRAKGLSGPLLVISWTTPMARRFYEPDEAVTGRRRYTIDARELQDIAELPLPAVATPEITTGAQPSADPFLLKVLSAARSPQMRDIVPTIQAEQYRLIRATAPITVIQGAAGTGKTIVALHRLAYVLQRMKDEQPNQNPAVAIIGPHRLFLHYVSAVLPALGHADAAHTTFEDWFVRWCGDPSIRFRARDAELEEMLDTSRDRRERVAAFRRAKLKGSLRMGEVLRRHVEMQRQELVSRLCAAPIRLPSPGAQAAPLAISVDQQTLSSIAKGLRDGPLNVQREQARDALWRHVESKPGTAPRDGPDRQAEAPPQVRSPVMAEFDRRWPRVNVVDQYFGLLSNAAILQRAANGILPPTQQQYLGASPIPAGVVSRGPVAASESRTLALEDLAPLAYLCLLLNGPVQGPGNPPTFHHLVVDEAQDLAPLQFKVLHEHAAGMTILGDVAQGIHSYRGLASWDELRPVFGKTPIFQAQLHHSYRSTRQLVEFANAILTKIPVDGLSPAEPFPRDGGRPVLRACQDDVRMVAMAYSVIDWCLRQRVGRVAVVCKTSAEAEQVAARLRAAGVARLTVLTSRNSGYTTDVVVVPAYLAKGMEFEAAIVVGADAERYQATEYDGKLLYIAVTRALHHLCVLWVGKPSPLLPSAA